MEEKDWKYSSDLSNVSTASLRELVLKLLERFCHMYTGTRGAIKAAEDLMDGNDGIFTIIQQTYRAEPMSLEVLEEHIKTQVDS